MGLGPGFFRGLGPGFKKALFKALLKRYLPVHTQTRPVESIPGVRIADFPVVVKLFTL